MVVNCSVFSLQEDAAFKAKQREQEKAMKDLKARAAQKGPMGE